MSDLRQQLELHEVRDPDTAYMERMARAILEAPREKNTVVWTHRMPTALHAELLKEAGRHGLTITDSINYVMWAWLEISRHSAPMKGRVVKHVDRRTRAKRKKGV